MVLVALVTHLAPEAVAADVEHLRRTLEDVRVVVCHGGRREDFDALELEDKVFVADEGLRGAAATSQSYTHALVDVHRRFVEPDPTIEHMLLLEFDQVVLRPAFLPRLLDVLEASGADVLGKSCGDRTGTNWWHRVRYREDPRLLRFLQRISVREDPRTLHGCLGTGFVVRRRVLEAFAAIEHLDGIYVELYLPTVFHHLGFRLEDVDRHSDLYAHVRWTPAYSAEEVAVLHRGGATVVHPYKAPDASAHAALLLGRDA